MGEIWDRIRRELGSAIKPCTRSEDNFIWKINPLKYLLVKEAYHVIHGQGLKVPWANFVWAKKIAPRHSFIMWLVAQQKLMTMDKLVHWGVISQNCCFLCSREEESHNHLFLKCSFVTEIWEFLKDKFPSSKITPADANSIEDLFISVGPQLANFWKIIISLVIYFVWRVRNEKRLGISSRTSYDVAHSIFCYFITMNSTPVMY